jgi:hypothetical protein
LSTVGFGDYCPRSNAERAIGAFMLLIGVALFSYIMGNFIDILDNYRSFEDDINDDEMLVRFFSTLYTFNEMQEI